jgi:hypothetical protein
MRKEDAVPQRGELRQRLGHRAQPTLQGRFEQDPTTAGRSVGHELELARVKPQQVAREQLGPRAHLERDAARTEDRAQLDGPGVQGLDEAGVRGGDDQAGAIGHGRARQRQRLLVVARTVVDSGQEMEVQLDRHTV